MSSSDSSSSTAAGVRVRYEKGQYFRRKGNANLHRVDRFDESDFQVVGVDIITGSQTSWLSNSDCTPCEHQSANQDSAAWH